MYDGNIYWYEALIQLSLYFGYVYMMAWSEWIENYITVNYINVNKDSSVTPGKSSHSPLFCLRSNIYTYYCVLCML